MSVDLTWIGYDPNADYIDVEYQVDGGGYVQVPNQVGGGSHTIEYTSGSGTSGSTTVNQGGITGNALRVRVCVDQNSLVEVTTIDNVSVPDATLPVELVAFGVAPSDTPLQLYWETRSETDNAGYSLEHRVPAGQETLLWQQVAWVEGAGTTLEPRRYSYHVSGLHPGAHQFRLKQIDFDGSFSYSSILEARVAVPADPDLHAAYPNPFAASTQITLSVPRRQRVSLHVFDVRGQRVATLHDGVLSEGVDHQFHFAPALSLPDGTYFYRVTGENFSAVRALMLVR